MSLPEIRAEIDRIDIELVKLLVRRSELAAQAKRHKRPDHAGISAPERVAQVLAKIRGHALDAGGDPDLLQRIYETIIRELTDMQLKDV